jgi:hypothetical protein
MREIVPGEVRPELAADDRLEWIACGNSGGSNGVFSERRLDPAEVMVYVSMLWTALCDSRCLECDGPAAPGRRIEPRLRSVAGHRGVGPARVRGAPGGPGAPTALYGVIVDPNTSVRLLVLLFVWTKNDLNVVASWARPW